MAIKPNWTHSSLEWWILKINEILSLMYIDKIALVSPLTQKRPKPLLC